MPARTVQTNTNGVQNEHKRNTNEYKWKTKTQEKQFLGRFRRLATEYQWVQTDTSGVQTPERIQTEYKTSTKGMKHLRAH